MRFNSRLPSASILATLTIMLIANLVLTPLSALAAPTSYDVKIDGMTCGSCVDNVKAALSKLPNVDKGSVKVVLKNKTATLTFTDDKKENMDAVKKAVENAGYKVTAINTASSSTTATATTTTTTTTNAAPTKN